MNALSQHPVTDTLTEDDVERLRSGLVDEAHSSLASGWAQAGSRRRSLPALAGIAAVVALAVGVVALDVGRTPPAAEAMFTFTPAGDWIDVAPNLHLTDFDADVAVEELRAAGFTAERGTFDQWTDAAGDTSVQAPEIDGLGLGSVLFEFADGTEVMFAIKGPIGAEFPTNSDGSMLDWDAAADQFGFRRHADRQGILELRRDAPITIWILTAP